MWDLNKSRGNSRGKELSLAGIQLGVTNEVSNTMTIAKLCNQVMHYCDSKEIHLFAGRAVKRERRKGSSRRQQPAYGAAVNEVACELLRSARSPKRENGGRRYIKHDGMIASPVGSCLCC